MSQHDIDVRHTWGCVLAEARDSAEQKHRWWFDETDAGRLVFISEVIHFEDLDDNDVGIDGRHYVDEADADVPPKIHDALADEGYETIVDTDAHIIER
jgi:hypothetical protein